MPNDSQIDDKNDGFEGGFGSKPPLNRLNKNQKVAVASLAVFAVFIVILWSVQLKNNIYGPFNSNLAGTNETAGISDQTASDLALKNKDTDSDGLSDYDELNFYKTSPYLADSDSDGIKDGEEIKKGTDPNCPTGRTCATSEFDGNGTSTPAASAGALNSLLNQFNAANPANASASQPAANSGTGNLTAEQKQALQGIDAPTLRQLLLTAGMDKAALDKISDQELMQSYNETLNSP